MKGLFAKLKDALVKPAAPVEQPDANPQEGMLVNAYCTCAEVPELQFAHTMVARRDLSDPELATHLEGFVGYVLSRGNGEMTRNRYHVMRHIQRVQQHLSLVVEDAQLDAFADWAVQANAILFMRDGGIRDPHGVVLLSAGGEEGDGRAAIPYPPQAWERKARTEALLSDKQMPPPQHLPPLISEPELRLRTTQEIAGRAFALLAMAVRAESVAAKDPLSAESLFESLPSARAHLTPKEQAFLLQEAPSESEVAQFAWRYECVFLLEWAMGLVDELPFPSAICDVPLTTRLLLDAHDEQGLMRAMRMRTDSEILDALDLHYRLHWLTRQAELKEQAVPAGLDAGVILERHRVLNWLVRFENKEWDEVDTPT
ncbi:DUF4272 domain-containing protein [Variovorax sp. IB41]|uniref:DUF4272 domain-containing protein n=1 Tax=Variovorax sp. IB41 TaxID=2779370 RepID=UPI0018E81268|nr:DUF4272 domain-containing protein [Variovorax sp. IB41]MBJ2158085.1 DUF4272 domain-containing protein [Variovorax sp. IB41]